MIMMSLLDDFNLNLIDDKNTSNFLDAMFSHLFLPFITTSTRITRNTKALNDNIFIKSLQGLN